MKIVTTLFLVTLSTFCVSAQELEIVNELNVTPIAIENCSMQIVNKVELLFVDDKSTIAKKKSYKYIIENTLSGRKNLIFKTNRGIKNC